MSHRMFTAFANILTSMYYFVMNTQIDFSGPSFGRQRTRASKPISSTTPIDETVDVTSAAPKPNFAERYNIVLKILNRTLKRL